MSTSLSPWRRPSGRPGAGLFAAVLLAAAALNAPAQTDPGSPQPPPRQVPVVTPRGGLPPSPPKTPRPPDPVPDSGANQSFSFQRAPENDGSYVVYPADGSEPVRVSDSFLGLILNNPQINDEQRAQVLKSYPKIIQKQFESTMTDMYPDASQAPGETFQPQALGTPDGPGGSASIEPDPLAPGYVRISLATPDGQVQEFSAAQSAIQRVLTNPNTSDEQKIQSLKTFPFKLPESARQNFKDLSRDELLDRVAELPDMKRQEFFKMRRYYAKSTTDNAQTETADMQTTVVPRASAPEPTVVAEATPEPAETPRPRQADVRTGQDGGDREPVVTASAPKPTLEEDGFKTTGVVAVGVVAIGLFAAVAVALRRGRR